MTYHWPQNQRCISTLGAAEITFPQLNRLCARFQVPMVEIRALEGRLDLPDYFAGAFENTAHLQEISKEWCFGVQVLDSSCRLAGTGDVARAELLELAPWADALNCPWIRVFDGGCFESNTSAKDFQGMVDVINWWRQQKAERGFKCDILVETHDLLCSSDNCLALQHLLDEPVALLWDSWHIWFKHGEALADTWQALKAFVQHIHFKDGLREAGERHPYTYRLPGEGVFPISQLLSLLEQAAYPHAICLEWERKWHPELPSLDRALCLLQ